MKLEGSLGASFEIYTGVVDCEVIMVNPTLTELNASGVNFNKEPEYISATPEGAKKIRLDFWVKPVVPEAGLNKISFFLEDVYKTSSKGNAQFINDFGSSTWGKDMEEALTRKDKNGNSWFKEDGARQAKSGEVELIEFLKNFAAVQKIAFEDINKIFNGNYTEIRELLNSRKGNKIQLLWYEKGGYQSIYNRYSQRGGNTRMTYWDGYRDKNKDNFDINYQNSWTFKPYTNVISISQTGDTPATGAGLWA